MRYESEPTITENEFLAILQLVAFLGKEGTTRAAKTPYLSQELVAECLNQITNGDPEDREVAIEALHTEVLTPLRDGRFALPSALSTKIQDLLRHDDEDEEPGNVL